MNIIYLCVIIILPLKKLFVCLPVFLLLVAVSCKKKDNGPVFGPYTMQSVFASMSISPIAVTFDASVGGSFYGASGARYYFPPFSLVRDSIQIEGPVQAQIAEYLKKSDMIFSSVLPYSNDAPLATGGAYYINITQNGQQVVLAKPLQYQVSLPMASSLGPEPLSLYFGRSDDTLISNLINWQPANDTSEGGVSLSGDSVVISSDSIHFNAASRSLGSPAYQSFSVQIKAPITTFSDTIVAYAIYDTIPVIWQMAASHNHIITETMVANYPLHFLVFTVIDGDFYAGFLAATPVSGNNYIVNLSKTSPAALRSQIDAL